MRGQGIVKRKFHNPMFISPAPAASHGARRTPGGRRGPRRGPGWSPPDTAPACLPAPSAGMRRLLTATALGPQPERDITRRSDGDRRQADHDRRRRAGRERRALADRGPRRPGSAPGPLPDRADGQLQPRAHPGAAAARQGRRRVRALRRDERRQRLHQGGGVPARHPDRHADQVLHRGGGAGQPGHLARPARLRAEVLHVPGQLRHGREQHPGLLRPRPSEVPALHPVAEAAGGQQPARPRHAVGFLDPVSGVGAPGDLADG